jgi:bifunctional NMN adenylyltransferase/nudix hydrolase
MYDFLAFIGRFQPFHAGHFKVLKTALEKSQNVIVIVGSANRPRTAKNPLTFDERKEIIESLLTSEEKARVQVIPCDDYMYNDTKWETQIQAIMRTATSHPWRSGPTEIGVIGHSKDHSSYYLKKFPQWDLLDIAQEYVVNATDIREAIYESKVVKLDWFVNLAHLNRVHNLFYTNDMDVIKREYQHIKAYKKQHAPIDFDAIEASLMSLSPPSLSGVVKFTMKYLLGVLKNVNQYPPIFVTTDAVVIQSGHVLLVKRGGMPGEGLWALPGGFLNQGETILQGMLRELVEETKIGVRLPKLEGSIERWFVADHPERSQRGRTVSHAALIRLPDSEQGLPKIKGSDDAADAKWVPLDDLTALNMFEDHWDVIDQFLGL